MEQLKQVSLLFSSGLRSFNLKDPDMRSSAYLLIILLRGFILVVTLGMITLVLQCIATVLRCQLREATDEFGVFVV